MASSGPKYRQICDSLRAAIECGTYTTGLRMPSEHELVQSFGASRVTVGRALKELELEGYVDRRAGSGTYVRAATAKNFTLGLLIPELGQTEIFEPICHGMVTGQTDQNHVLVWGRSINGPETTEMEAKDVCSRLISSRVSGVFFAPIEANPQKDEINRAISRMLAEARIPVVLLDRDIVDYPQRSEFDIVGIDNRRAGCLATQHLIDVGCRRIGFLGRPHLAPSCVARYNGYRDAVNGSRAHVGSEFIERLDPADKTSISNVIKRYRPDGIVCSNDRTAAMLLRTFSELKIKVPDQIRLVGFDDVKYASLVTVPLTTVRQPCDQLGAAAMQAMVQRIGAPDMPPRDILVDFRLVIRESCGAQFAGPIRNNVSDSLFSPVE